MFEHLGPKIAVTDEDYQHFICGVPYYALLTPYVSDLRSYRADSQFDNRLVVVVDGARRRLAR